MGNTKCARTGCCHPVLALGAVGYFLRVANECQVGLGYDFIDFNDGLTNLDDDRGDWLVKVIAHF